MTAPSPRPTLRTDDDVRRVCEDAGLLPDIRTSPVYSWHGPSVEVRLVGHSECVYVRRRRPRRVENARMATIYMGAPPSLLLAAIRAAEEADRG